MVVKVIIGDKGLAYRIESESEMLHGRNVGDVFDGKELKSELDGYQLQITGGSDFSGFPLSKDIEGLALRTKLLKKGFGMKDSTKGLRLRKTLRGKQISQTTAQINIKVVKAGKTPLAEVFPDQNKPKEETKAPKAEAPAAA